MDHHTVIHVYNRVLDMHSHSHKVDVYQDKRALDIACFWPVPASFHERHNMQHQGIEWRSKGTYQRQSMQVCKTIHKRTGLLHSFSVPTKKNRLLKVRLLTLKLKIFILLHAKYSRTEISIYINNTKFSFVFLYSF